MSSVLLRAQWRWGVGSSFELGAETEWMPAWCQLDPEDLNDEPGFSLSLFSRLYSSLPRL